MDYTYFFETQVNKNIEASDILNTKQLHNFLYILCYNINDTTKYPFLQFMMEKIPFCNNFIKEEFTLPFVLFNHYSNIEELVLNKVKISLKSVGCDDSKVTNEMYKGVFLDNTYSYKAYVLINISEIDISGLNLCRNSSIWFILPSEIMNTKNVCNIDIDEEVTDLFINMPHLGLLTNPKTEQTYIIPDTVYTGGEYKNVEFASVFGNIKSKEYDSCDKYYYFFRSFKDATKYGGWVRNGGIRKIDMDDNTNIYNSSGKLIVENDYGRYVNGGINRYALFIEGKMYLERGTEFLLNDKYIVENYQEPTIVICYSSVHDIRPDILVKNYEQFASLSFHSLNKGLLDDKYIEINNGKYMIL
jgi:hypothetical protein